MLLAGCGAEARRTAQAGASGTAKGKAPAATKDYEALCTSNRWRGSPCEDVSRRNNETVKQTCLAALGGSGYTHASDLIRALTPFFQTSDTSVTDNVDRCLGSHVHSLCQRASDGRGMTTSQLKTELQAYLDSPLVGDSLKESARACERAQDARDRYRH